MGEWLYYNILAEGFTQRKLVADFIRLKFNFIKKQKKQSPLGDLRVTYALHL